MEIIIVFLFLKVYDHFLSVCNKVDNDEGELAEELQVMERSVRELEIAQENSGRAFLSNPYDLNDCLISITCGSGGSDAQDWVAMLLRMYYRYANSKHFDVKVIEEVDAADVGLKSCELRLRGRPLLDTTAGKELGAYGWMKGETGVHRLVRVSPFNAQGKRQTSFAAIQVLPLFVDGDEAEIYLPDSVHCCCNKPIAANVPHIT